MPNVPIEQAGVKLIIENSTCISIRKENDFQD